MGKNLPSDWGSIIEALSIPRSPPADQRFVFELSIFRFGIIEREMKTTAFFAT